MADLKDQDMEEGMQCTTHPDMEEGMQCTTHPYTKNPGGICALCLQEKLGKLVTSSFPLSKPTNHLSSSSPPKSSTALSLSSNSRDSTNNLPFLLAKKKKEMLAASSYSSLSSSASSSSSNLIYKRSKSTAATYSERKRNGFWSFFHLYSSKHQIATTTKKVENFSHSRKNPRTDSSNRVDVIVEEEEEDEKSPSFGKKVLRSRSVGCGSRSFSGDLFERISKRIESQREPTKVISNGGEMSDMVKCGGIFGGFMIMTSSSSSTTSVDHGHGHKMGSRSWGWAFASPMRAKMGKRGRTITESITDKNTSSNLDSIPSMVTLKS